MIYWIQRRQIVVMIGCLSHDWLYAAGRIRTATVHIGLEEMSTWSVFSPRGRCLDIVVVLDLIKGKQRKNSKSKRNFESPLILISPALRGTIRRKVVRESNSKHGSLSFGMILKQR